MQWYLSCECFRQTLFIYYFTSDLFVEEFDYSSFRFLSEVHNPSKIQSVRKEQTSKPRILCM
jgi:hypothetical protein